MLLKYILNGAFEFDYVTREWEFESQISVSTNMVAEHLQEE